MEASPPLHASIVLAGVVGSRAYGLDHPGSDTDRQGIYTASPVDFFSLTPPTDHNSTQRTVGPDVTLHELTKAVRLLLKCNPTISELLWLPAYETITPTGQQLVDMRTDFLSARLVRDAYLGYATQQFQHLFTKSRFGNGMDARREKHARHLYRLLGQGWELYSTGRLEVRVADREACFEFGREVANDPDADAARILLAHTQDLFDRARSPLPDEPHTVEIDLWLRNLRRADLTRPEGTAA